MARDGAGQSRLRVVVDVEEMLKRINESDRAREAAEEAAKEANKRMQHLERLQHLESELSTREAAILKREAAILEREEASKARILAAEAEAESKAQQDRDEIARIYTAKMLKEEEASLARIKASEIDNSTQLKDIKKEIAILEGFFETRRVELTKKLDREIEDLTRNKNALVAEINALVAQITELKAQKDVVPSAASVTEESEPTMSSATAGAGAGSGSSTATFDESTTTTASAADSRPTLEELCRSYVAKAEKMKSREKMDFFNKLFLNGRTNYLTNTDDDYYNLTLIDAAMKAATISQVNLAEGISRSASGNLPILEKLLETVEKYGEHKLEDGGSILSTRDKGALLFRTIAKYQNITTCLRPDSDSPPSRLFRKIIDGLNIDGLTGDLMRNPRINCAVTILLKYPIDSLGIREILDEASRSKDEIKKTLCSKIKVVLEACEYKAVSPVIPAPKESAYLSRANEILKSIPAAIAKSDGVSGLASAAHVTDRVA